MRDIVLWSLATAATLFQATQSLELVKRSNPAVVGFEIERRKVDPLEHDRRRRKRQDDGLKVVNQTLDNERTLYFANLTLGTPPQKLRMHIDTGSSDLWVNTPSSQICSARQDYCATGGTYDPEKSSTYKRINDDFNITYADGSGAAGDYVTDNMGIGGITLKNFQFAVGYKSSSREGVLGIGYTDNEVAVVRNDDDPYPNLPQALVNDRFIRSNAYSIWLNDLDANKGEILFGGVNTAKFEGSLRTVPVVRHRRTLRDLSVALTGLAVKTSAGTQRFPAANFPFAAVLDTGSSLSYLPEQMVSDIYDAVSAVWDQESGAAFVPCDVANVDAAFIFTFSGIDISVGMDEMVIRPRPNSRGQVPRFRDGTEACIFGIAPAITSISILGDTFLRSAYLVYDLANNEISMAQTRFNSTSNDILEIGTGPDSVPNATGVASAVSSADITATATAETTLSPIATNSGMDISRARSSTAAAAPTLSPDYPLGMIAGLAGAGMVFAAM